ncbi:hypothetical protein DRO42_04710 [Candidatus Bathyarchaeota archaeon]|nr:MAG: hypothetical protein DRO42_04710 [Candidatus Bathyarchaeota archaeon]
MVDFMIYFLKFLFITSKVIIPSFNKLKEFIHLFIWEIGRQPFRAIFLSQILIIELCSFFIFIEGTMSKK